MSFNLRFALKELKSHLSFTLLTVVSLMFGLLGILGTDHFERSARYSIAQKSRELLSADLQVELRRPLNESELAILEQAAGPEGKKSYGLSFYSMVSHGESSQLTLIDVIDASYPLIGNIISHPVASFAELFKEPSVVFSKGLAQLIPDQNQVEIAGKTFRVAGIIAEDNTQGQGFFELAPSLYMSAESFKTLGLPQAGSTLRYHYSFLFPDNTNLEPIKQRVERAFPDPAIRILTPEDSQENLSRLIGFLSDYLSLVALVGVFLTASAGSFLFRAYLETRRRDIATFLCLGGKRSSVVTIYLLQVFAIGLVAALSAYILAYLAVPYVAKFLAMFVPIKVLPHLSGRTFTLMLGLAILVGPIFNLPNLMKLFEIRPLELFHETSIVPVRSRPWAAWMPAALLLFLLSVYVAESWKVGSLFFAGVTVSCGVLFFIFKGIVACLSFSPQNTWLKHGLIHLRRHREFSSALFMATAIIGLLVSLIPQIKESILFDYSAPIFQNRPDLFLFDIQSAQRQPLESFARENNITLQTLTPLIRARLVKVNDQSFDRMKELSDIKTREQQRERDFKNRGFNLTYRSTLEDSETMVKGRPFATTVNPELAEISLEERFAERLQLKMGDKLEFDISGLSVKGEVVNFRKVRWASFQPNFFVVFQPGFLEDAPKTYLATLSNTHNPGLIQGRLFKAFPTISALQVQTTVERIISILSQMTSAMQIASYLVFIAGLLVFGSISHYQLIQRKKELALLKAVGAPFRWIRLMVFSEYSLIIVLGTLCGVVVSLGVSTLLSLYIYDRLGLWLTQSLLFTAVSTVVLAVIICAFVLKRVLRLSTHTLLID